MPRTTRARLRELREQDVSSAHWRRHSASALALRASVARSDPGPSKTLYCPRLPLSYGVLSSGTSVMPGRGSIGTCRPYSCGQCRAAPLAEGRLTPAEPRAMFQRWGRSSPGATWRSAPLGAIRDRLGSHAPAGARPPRWWPPHGPPRAVGMRQAFIWSAMSWYPRPFARRPRMRSRVDGGMERGLPTCTPRTGPEPSPPEPPRIGTPRGP